MATQALDEHALTTSAAMTTIASSFPQIFVDKGQQSQLVAICTEDKAIGNACVSLQ